LEIVRSHLPFAEFVFLSARHTAEVTEGSTVDEALHPTAAVQYCGFRRSGAWSGRCVRWWTKMDGTWPKFFTRRYSRP
ncbi:hypothetical protein EDB84DRAFT_1272301, partial [Lactarius hengduanensis]